MKICLDVHYENDTARTAGISFQNWNDKLPTKEFTHISTGIKPYESGKFYKRELPCLISLLQNLPVQPDLIIIDGHVWLDEKNLRLGGHLYKKLNQSIPVVGVAKNQFNPCSKVKKVFRGRSKTPLYVSSIGYPLKDAINGILKMDGRFRIPTLLKKVDQLSKGIIEADV